MIDVCLVLEGTYPFVAGGVSTWIHQLVSSMRDIRFSVLYISPFPNPHREYKYDMPANILDIQDLYLHDYDLSRELSPRARRRENFARLTELHERFMHGDRASLLDIVGLLRDPGGITARDIFESEEAWEAVTWFYGKYGEEVSFVDFFWTWRSIYLPLLQTLTAPIPRARLYHTVSTGYAGLFASMAKARTDKRLLLTEHGVYTHERMLEISQADWICSPQDSRFRIQKELPFFKRFWIGLFDALGQTAYHFSDSIVTLYEGNRTKEILAGAEPKKISIIPNGIDLDRYREIRRVRERGARPVIAFIGRVVAIKDVKTFLNAAKIVLGEWGQADFLILGPTEEEPEYTAECRQLVQTLGIGEWVHFLGKVNVLEYYSKIDIVALTSLSEAQPYVIIEANAAGVPVVATDVGACREMVDGRLADDRRLGPSGLVTPVADPEKTAEAVIRLIREDRLWHEYAEAGRKRAAKYYAQDDLVSEYLTLYEQNMR